MSANVKDVLQQLQGAGGSLRCDELRRLLETLGFEVRDGKKAGHKVVTHAGLPSFYSTSYTCGHGKNPEIKPAYVRNIRRMLEEREPELSQWLKGETS
ncbi:hypothetical protein [Thioalkalivibrio sp. ALE19]|uniref:hypothetical protein n=1 Tax=Thioalkalivibrio sp. ALE19 TaxID=1266909 RepID=UPI0009DAF088|nr:hypothetical protein [Thioalkalivibrio sp. ALE19]